MKLARLRLRNFRCYSDEVAIDFADFTAIMGANDIGKSTILEALAIFFDQRKLEQDDAAVDGDPTDIAIICEFDEADGTIVVDSAGTTTLEQEFLLNASGKLEIHREYNASTKSPKTKTYFIAEHPSTPKTNDLLRLKRAELKDRCLKHSIDLADVNETVSAELRQALRDDEADLKLGEQRVDTDLAGTKDIYSKIAEQLPAFFIFTADRPSTDQDSEAQDPMRAAVRLALASQEEKLEQLAADVKIEIDKLVQETLENVLAMSPELADELKPSLSKPKWDSIFKISLTSDSEIPLNKRGSGFRRLILLGFLQAQARALQIETPGRGTIYAIEEPETSQHPDNQKKLLQALREIAEDDGQQVIMTTHNANLVRVLPNDCLRFVRSNDGPREVLHGRDEATCGVIRQALGVHPDHDVRIFVGVEGVNDEAFLLRISKLLADDHIRPFGSLVDQGRLIFVPLGGSSLNSWVARLAELGRREFHIFDRDFEPPADPHYSEEAARINLLTNASAVHTTKRMMENYLHHDAIMEAHEGLAMDPIADFDDVPEVIAKVQANKQSVDWDQLSSSARKTRKKNVKSWLNTDAVSNMTRERLRERDPGDELIGWLREITEAALAD